MVLRFWLVITLQVIGCQVVFSQNKLLQNTVIMNILRQGARKMYNYDFDGADNLFNQAEKLIPQHPAPVLLKGVNTYWRYLPLHSSSTQIGQMEKYLQKTIELSQAMQDKDENDVEGVFFELTARSLMMQHYSKIGQHLKAVNEAKSLYGLIKQGIEMKDEFNEFYFTTGLYNYYREAYPEAKPVYKPFAWLFQSGDKKLGIQQLVYAGKNCVITQTQSYAFLTTIYLTYEKNVGQAVGYAEELVKLYPQNRLFVCRYAETLLLAKQYDKAQPLIQQLLTEASPEMFTPMITQVLAGILEEKKDKNNLLAKSHYLKAIQAAILFKEVGNHYQAYAYLGLSRIAKQEKDDKKAKEYLKKAKDLAEYEYIFSF